MINKSIIVDVLIKNGIENAEKIADEILLLSIINKAIEKKERDFYNSLIPFLGQYDKKMIREFYDYWGEANATGKKLRYEMEKTWDITKRLTRWANNNKEFKGKEKPNQTTGEFFNMNEKIIQGNH